VRREEGGGRSGGEGWWGEREREACRLLVADEED